MARSAGIPLAAEGDPKPSSPPMSTYTLRVTRTHAKGQPKNATAPIANTNRFPPKDNSWIPRGNQLLPDDWVWAPARMHHAKDGVEDYYRAGTGGKGWEGMHAERVREGEKEVRKARANFKFPKVRDIEGQGLWRKGVVKRKEVLITPKQWVEKLARDMEEEERRRKKAKEDEAQGSRASRNNDGSVRRPAGFGEGIAPLGSRIEGVAPAPRAAALSTYSTTPRIVRPIG
ncbi:hypothetical protein BU23DRAFT_566953 [Bimuria novae-zelandiae CBS 107.79]|uniref:Uncharacterized protein n=1 Tax=Bimuria novae-zelandiae CBS 107.79 TaxID=1447943 RepID=A0A6A5VNP9_9PLEO|nr:hypothetical protein BU23DRAFT_566953 [Bimuria novae-zelandiae CBS 107.79]